MQVSIDIEALNSLLEHAASAALLIGHLDADEMVARALGEHIDEVVHELTEFRARQHSARATTALGGLLIVDASIPEDVS